MRNYSPRVVRAYEHQLTRSNEATLARLLRLAADFDGPINKQIAAVNLLAHRIREVRNPHVGSDLRVLMWELQLLGDVPALRVAAQQVERKIIAHRVVPVIHQSVN